MPTYTRFLKEVIAKKRNIVDLETVHLTEECRAVIQSKLPAKLKDPGSVTLLCNLGGGHCEKALCDLGASINLMPLSIFKRLGIGELRPTSMTLQMTDRSRTRRE